MNTTDEPAPGLRVVQPARGFRYGAEAFWLAGFALETGPFRTALELGTGSGVVALLLARQGVDVVGVDARPEWEPLWRETLAGSKTSGAVRFELRDLADGLTGSYDCVLANPPFFAAGTGPVAADPWKRAARTESTATLARFVEVATGVLAPNGRACFVVPVEREAELLAATRLVPRRVVRVGRRRCLVELTRHGAPGEPVSLGEDAPAVRAWYEALR